MSFHAYEGNVPVDVLSDEDIVPSEGENPFLVGTKRSRAGSYEVRVVGGPRPPAADREPNTLYAGEGLNGEPLATASVIYRVYLPEVDARGGVPLPTLTYELPGSDAAVPLPSCDRVRPGGEGAVNPAIAAASLPVDSPGLPLQPPTWGISRSRPRPNQLGPASVMTGNLFFANFDNEYLSLLVGRNAGDVIAFRAKAPTFPDTRGAKRMEAGDVRYWSFCTNEFATTRYVACIADEAAIVDESGHVTVVISDATDRPSTLRPTDNWLPWGPYPDVMVLYRHMRPAASFAGAIQRVPMDATGSAIASSMGEYYPVPVVCRQGQFDIDRCGIG